MLGQTNSSVQNIPQGKKIAHINGMTIPVDENTTWVGQEKNGVWFQWSKKPRIVKYEDEFKDEDMCFGMANKKPITFKTAEGYLRVLVTKLTAPNWQETITRVIDVKDLPHQMFLGSQNK